METVIINYKSGNIASVTFALNRIGIESVITDDIEKIKSSDRVIFPGVGEAKSAMNYLKEKKLDLLIPSLKQPVLGICLGMQLMCSSSEEGNTSCLGIFKQRVKLFPTGNLKVPHIGWNNISDLRTDLFNGICENEYQYFVHSYYVEIGDLTIATTNYNINYSAALRKNNFYGVQFHPEKSGTAGQVILQNFFRITR